MKILDANMFFFSAGMHDLAFAEFGIEGKFLRVPRNMQTHAGVALERTPLKFPIVSDPEMSPGRIELRTAQGETLAVIENVAIPCGEFTDFASTLRQGLDTLPDAPTSREN